MLAHPAIAKVVLTPPPLIALPSSTCTPCLTLQKPLHLANCQVRAILNIMAWY